MSEDWLKRFKIEYAAAGVIVVILFFTLFTRPIIGVADNGDFARIMKSTGLHYLSDDPADRYFGYVNRLYGTSFAMPFMGPYISTELPLVLLAVFINKAATASVYFDIRFLAAIYSIIFITAGFFLVRYLRMLSAAAGIAATAAIILVFCDTGYISYFNSLYGEPLSLVSILLMASMALTLAVAEKPALWMLLLFSAGAFFFAGAKLQNTPTGILAALLLIMLARLGGNALWRKISVAAAMMVVAVSLVCYAGVAKNIRLCNKYQAVFYGILRGSPDPAADLEELGIDPSYSVLAGTNYFMDEYPVDIKSPEFQKVLSDKVNYINILRFYLKHPRRFLQKLEYAAENRFKINQGVGNYEKYPGIRYKQVADVLNGWGWFKLNVLPNNLRFVISFYALVIPLLIIEYARAKEPRVRFLAAFMGFIALMGAVQFVLPIIGDGDADLSKHLFLFNVGFDLLAVSSAVYISSKAAAAVRRLKSPGFSR
ncbi:MAG: hypothetical protein ACM3XR_04370 [Bacillota bacterium]